VRSLNEKGLGCTLRDSSMLLAGHNERVDDLAAIVDRHMAHQGHGAGLGVNLHHRHMSTERKSR
jgi:hypothetical protein